MSKTNLCVWSLHWRVPGSNPGADKTTEGVLVVGGGARTPTEHH